MSKPLKSPSDYNLYTCYSWDEFWETNKKNYTFSSPQSSKIINRFCRRCHDLLLNNPEGIRFSWGTLMVAGVKGDFKNQSVSTKDKKIDYKNLKTDKVVYSVRYIFGLERGRVYTGYIWRFRTTVPLRQRIKKMIDEDNFKSWYTFDTYRDVPAFQIPSEKIRYHKIYIKNKKYNP